MRQIAQVARLPSSLTNGYSPCSQLSSQVFDLSASDDAFLPLGFLSSFPVLEASPFLERLKNANRRFGGVAAGGLGGYVYTEGGTVIGDPSVSGGAGMYKTSGI